MSATHNCTCSHSDDSDEHSDGEKHSDDHATEDTEDHGCTCGGNCGCQH